jgi:hypothetical protein
MRSPRLHVSVINAAARSIFRLRRFDYASKALAELHWPSAADHITFKVATLFYCCLHEAAPRYPSSALHLVTDVDTRRRLRSSADTQLLVTPRCRLVTAGDRSFQPSGHRRDGDMEQSAIRCTRSTISAVLQTAAENFLFSRFYSRQLYSMPVTVQLAVF